MSLFSFPFFPHRHRPPALFPFLSFEKTEKSRCILHPLCYFSTILVLRASPSSRRLKDTFCIVTTRSKALSRPKNALTHCLHSKLEPERVIAIYSLLTYQIVFHQKLFHKHTVHFILYFRYWLYKLRFFVVLNSK